MSGNPVHDKFSLSADILNVFFLYTHFNFNKDLDFFVFAVHCEYIKKLLIAALTVFSTANCSCAEGDSNLSVHLSD